MTAYNFMDWIAPKVLDGSKLHTVRANGKRRHAKAGDLLQLYTGMRTKNCRLLKEVECVGAWPVHLPCSAKYGPMIWSINGRPMDTDTMFDFAVGDGFADVFDMTEWVLKTHGQDFHGTLIAWGWPYYLPGAPQDETTGCPHCGYKHHHEGMCPSSDSGE